MAELQKPWLGETNWLVLIEFLRRDDDEGRAQGAEAIGCMLAYANMTDTRMLALMGEDAYELLFSFSSAENRIKFLRLLQSNDATACERDEILSPDRSEIEAAQPIANVLPEDVLRRALVIAAMYAGDDAASIH